MSEENTEVAHPLWKLSILKAFNPSYDQLQERLNDSPCFPMTKEECGEEDTWLVLFHFKHARP